MELSSGRCDAAVAVSREALQVFYQAEGGGGGGDTGSGFKALGRMNWSQIVSWSLVHQVSV